MPRRRRSIHQLYPDIIRHLDLVGIEFQQPLVQNNEIIAPGKSHYPGNWITLKETLLIF